MEVYSDLVSAISNQSPDDKRRIYHVTVPIEREADGTAIDTPDKFVIATSPATAALAVLGESNVVLVSQRDRYDATRQALHQTIEAHNLSVEKKCKTNQ